MHLGATTCKITIGEKYVLRGVHTIEIKKSIYQMLQTAAVKLPLSVVMRNKELLERIRLIDKIKEGDKITLEFGYDGKHRQEFEGYIRRINTSMPLELICEDQLYLLRQVIYKESFKEVSLKTIIEILLKGLEEKFHLKIAIYNAMPEMSFKNFIIKEANGIQVLQELKDKYGLTSYLTTINGIKTLYVGLSTSLLKNRVKYAINRNTINASDLKFNVSDEVKPFRVKVTVYKRNGTNEVFEFGDKDAELKTVTLFGDYDKGHVEQAAKAELEKYKVKGYRGNLDAFLIPACEPGTIAEITDPQFPDRKGNYYVTAVTTAFGVAGGKRNIELGIKVSV